MNALVRQLEQIDIDVILEEKCLLDGSGGHQQLAGALAPSAPGAVDELLDDELFFETVP